MMIKLLSQISRQSAFTWMCIHFASTGLGAQALSWAKVFTNLHVSPSVEIDELNSQLYITAKSSIGSSIGSLSVPGPATGLVAYVARFDTSGQALWVRSFNAKPTGTIVGGFPSQGAQKKLLIDPRGCVHVLWHTSLGVDKFYPGGQSLNTNPGAVLLTLDTSGNLIHTLSLVSNHEYLIRGMALNADGQLTITGSFSGQITLGNKTLISVGKRDAFVFRYNPLQYDAAQTKAGQMSSPEDDDGYDVVIDESGNTYLSGKYSGICDVDPDPNGIDQLLVHPVGNGFSYYLVKLSPNFELEWSRQVHSLSQYTGRLEMTSKNEVVISQVPDASASTVWYFITKFDQFGNEKLMTRLNHLSPTGTASLSWTFGASDTLYALTEDKVATYEAFRFTAYDTTGAEMKSILVSGTDYVSGENYALDSKGNSYLAAGFKGTVDLDPSSGVFMATAPAPYPERTFLLKWNLWAPDSISAVYEQDLPFELTFYPNPVQPGQDLQLRIAGEYTGPLNVKVWAGNGQCIKEIWVQKHGDMLELPLALPEKANGVLFFSLTDQDGDVLTKKVIEID